jgi:beta-glucanase (GH16 family)
MEKPEMRAGVAMLAAVVLMGMGMCGCGGSGTTTTITSQTQTIAPTIVSTTSAGMQNGATLVNLGSKTSGALIYYTVDGSAPTANSTRYTAPFLLDSSVTVNAVAQAPGDLVSSVASQSFTLNVPSGTLVWSDEFTNTTGVNVRPNPSIWMYVTGMDTNSSVDIHCAYDSSTSPCDPNFPNSYVGTDSYLHIVAQQPSDGVYTSARMETQGAFSFQYGRLEARIQVPEGQGVWPAFWLEGNNAATLGWPGCGEMDVMERINAAGRPPAGTQSNPPAGTTDWNEGSIHGTGFTGGNLGSTFDFTGGATAAGWHTYGMIKTPNSIAYYVDDPTHPYATFTPSSIAGLSGSVWPFDNGQGNYIILNIALGGTWPGPVDATTTFPVTMLVDYVRLYTN